MLSTILSLLFPIFDWILKKYVQDEQSKRDYIAFLEIMSRKGIKSASNRLAAQEQIDAVNKLWEKEKQEAKPK
jgi:hypothetical protein